MQLAYRDREVSFDPRWARTARSVGMMDFAVSEDGFSELLGPSRASCPFPKRASGIYFWLADNGEAYVGKAVDVQSRLRQHYKSHRDLICAGFLSVAAENLDREERRIVGLAERDFPLRNIKLVKETSGFRPLDTIVERDQQAKFLQFGNSRADIAEPRRLFPALETRSRAKRGAFATESDLSEFLQAAVSEFVQAAVPRPSATENRFWSATYFGKDYVNLVRVNVGQQEVFTVCQGEKDASDDDIVIRVVVPAKLSVETTGPRYETNSLENWFFPQDAAKLFAETDQMRAVREFVLWLARHTTPLNLRSHCPWLYRPEATDRWERENRTYG